MAGTDNALHMRDRDQWRLWLASNHATASEQWLLFHKKHTGKPGLGYDEAVEEALCFGWIDGILRRVDDEKHMIRFSPRRRNSVWSPTNKRRVARMIREGRITEAGLAKVREAKANGHWAQPDEQKDTRTIPPELARALAGNQRAHTKFETLADSYRRQFIQWVGTAKRAETRSKRAAESVRLLVAGKRLGMK